jgi:protein-tyrosine phosphatase
MSQSCIPPYFSWIVDKTLAISAFPFHHTHLKYLSKNGIHSVVSINSPDLMPPFETTPDLECIQLTLPECYPPTLEDCQNFVNLMDRAKARGEVNDFFVLFII